MEVWENKLASAANVGNDSEPDQVICIRKKIKKVLSDE